MHASSKDTPLSMSESTKKSSDDSQVGAILAQWHERNSLELVEAAAHKKKPEEPEPQVVETASQDKPIATVPHADVTIVTSDGGTIKAHKLILALRSEVFSVMFMSQMTESTHNEVHIIDFNPFVVNVFIDYFYSDSIGSADVALCSDLYAMARKYQVSGLEDLCEHQLLQQLNPSIVLDVLTLGDFHGGERLRSAALRYITLSSPQLVGMPAFMEKMRQYMDLIHETTPRERLPRAPSTSSVEQAPVITPMNEHLRQLLQALAGVGPMGAVDAPVQTPGGCLCHTCRIHRSTAATYYAHSSINTNIDQGGRESPQTAVAAVPPLLFDSPLTYDESSSLSNSANQTAAANTPANTDSNELEQDAKEEEKRDDADEKSVKSDGPAESVRSAYREEEKEEALRLRQDFDEADAKRRRVESPKW